MRPENVAGGDLVGGDRPSRSIEIDRSHGGAAPANTLDFSASLNPVGMPGGALEAYYRAAAQITSYPPPYSHRLESALAKWVSVPCANVIAANGSAQLIYLIARVFRPLRPYILIPTFSEIANALISVDCPPLPIRLRAERNFAADLAEISAALESGADAIFLGRPNSPTGGVISREMLDEIIALCARSGALCVIDEAFIDLAEEQSLVSAAAGNPRMIVLRSLTKAFAIPGLRLGFAVMSEFLAANLRRALEPWAVNSAAEAVAMACLDCADDHLRRSRGLIANERGFLTGALARQRRFRLFPSAANFLMFQAFEERSAGEFGAHMLAHGVAVRDLASLPGCGPGFYRIAIRPRSENEKLLEALARW
ncbi:MAG: pyridoxal phosphate-dependent aminotransferase [Candidatus Binataceae bacterium]